MSSDKEVINWEETRNTFMTNDIVMNYAKKHGKDRLSKHQFHKARLGPEEIHS